LPIHTKLFDQARRLSVEEKIELVEALWDDIANRNAVPHPTAAQRAELDRRLDDHLANPEDAIGWDEVKASALARIGR
jgi:putative addiction module component (TIGR02574 family)